MVSKASRAQVMERASGCCEYCRLPSSPKSLPFQIDHIIPKRHDGSNELNNLCLACVPCNLTKGAALAGIDSETNVLTPLYNPRVDVWTDNFKINDKWEIEGITAIGRVTVYVLRMNDKDSIEARVHLAELGQYPCQP